MENVDTGYLLIYCGKPLILNRPIRKVHRRAWEMNSQSLAIA